MGRFLAIDHGQKRIGLALSDPDKIISKPLKTISYLNYGDLLKELILIINKHQV